MYRTTNTFPLPVRRRAAAVGAAVALAAGAAVLAPGAQAAPAGDPHGGASTAAVLRAGLDVSLLGKAVDVPVDVALNDVHAPADAKKTALTVTVGKGVENGRGISILRADVATSKATADAHKAEGYANVAHAQVHVPGLPLLALVKADAITSTATCEAGRKPTAHSELAGLTVLGQRINLGAVGTTELTVPGVGHVSLNLTQTTTTSTTAAATALRLAIHLNPLSLGVAEISGEVTLAQATCTAPRTGGTTGGSTSGSTSGTTSGSTSGSTSGTTSGTTAGSTSGSTTGTTSGTSGSTTTGSTNGATTGSTSGSTTGSTTGSTSGSTSGTSGSATSGTSGSGGTSGSASGTSTGASGSAGTSGTSGAVVQTGPDTGNLAETGASSGIPYMAGGAVALLVAGAGAYLLTARRRRGAGAADPQD
ncbi:SCO1860 family LAETG-anchored protein [Streptomyces sp. NPDC021020]|uniref:SCO1860 family LAETG-anchored protein n=1 Tax=Streptomyces sp. NPDC021020 TaxID=3365109 RepID=UPI003788F9E3